MKASLSAAAALLALAACADGDAERAGERADSAIEETTEGARNLTDGTLENAGEAVDRAGDDVERAAKRVGEETAETARNAQREVEDATDGREKPR